MNSDGDLLIVGDISIAEKFISEFKYRNSMALYFIASTRTSTIPGISIAGSTSEATLCTPGLDVEYLVLGMPVSMNVIPVTPDGIPTPALLTRVALGLLGIPYIVVDTGSYLDPKIPHVDLPSRTIGDRIDSGSALPREVAIRLFEEARILGRMLGSKSMAFIVGESMPGGTTTAMAIMESLGYRAIGRVSSAGPDNPHKLKEEVFRKGIENSGLKIPIDDVFRAIAAIGDPLHISIAGFVAGVLEKNSIVLLAGGTQMCSVLAILKKLGIDLRERVAIGTTKWIIEDSSSDIRGLVRDIAPEIPIIATKLSFNDVHYKGLKAYEEGYVKEGVGAGGTIVALTILKDIKLDELKKSILYEYERLLKLGLAEKDRTD